MVRTTNLARHHPALQDVISCAFCGTPMTLNGSYYQCARRQEGMSPDCNTPSVRAEDLIRGVMEKLVSRIITPDSTEQLVESLKNKADEELHEIAMRYRDAHQPGGGPIDIGKVFDEYTKEEYKDTEIGFRLADAMEITYKSPRSELRETVSNPIHYLDYADPEDTKAIISAFVKDLQVGVGEIRLTYSLPLADDHHRPTVTSELLSV